ncbi:alanine racemase [Pseudahrensia aquimaris]|uniref:Alanine racemase n=1 Tax=Pseudahrensia aquimaris TaxID=744461 RepID=A0ABW3FDS3_9HYPH
MAVDLADLAGGRLTIDLGALVSNWQHLAKSSGAPEAGAVVKADAYGCGIERAVPALRVAGCRTFFVALVAEGMRVKASAPDSRVFVLNGLFAGAESAIHSNGLIPVLNTLNQVERWAAFARELGTPTPCAIQIDSGMRRVGMSPRDLERVVSLDYLMPHLDIQLLMTHFACADDIGHPKSEVQREVFEHTSALLPDVPRSAANSAASLQGGDFAYDLARPGVALYGGEALNDVANPVRPVATLEGRIMQITKGAAGDSVGYGGTETLKRDSRIAYVSVGYADGYLRSASNMGVPLRAVAPAATAWFKGHSLRGVGRISMDMCGFDVTDVPKNEIAEGDWIELIGPNVPLDNVARAAGTIGYELLTGLGARYERIYVGG